MPGKIALLSFELLFALVVVGFFAFGDELVATFLEDDPLAAVRIITGVAARIIRDHVIHKILVCRGRELMCLARDEKERISRLYLRHSIAIPHQTFARNDQIHFRLGAMSVVGTIAFPFWNPHPREIERMSFAKI